MLTLQAPGAEAELVPENGGRFVSLRVAGHDLLLTRDDDLVGTHWGAFVMAPWAGRIRNGAFRFGDRVHQLPIDAGPHAIHGTVRHRHWAVDDAKPDRARLSCGLGPVWPWAGWCEQELTLSPAGLDVRIAVHSEADPFPASAGWHPWFRRRVDGRAAALELPARSMYQRDAAGIPTGELVPPPPGPWDDCFTDLSGPARLRWSPTRDLTIETNGPCLVVFDHPADAICIEPQTGPTDALNLAPTLVTPDNPLSLDIRLRWRT